MKKEFFAGFDQNQIGDRIFYLIGKQLRLKMTGSARGRVIYTVHLFLSGIFRRVYFSIKILGLRHNSQSVNKDTTWL